MKLSFAFLLSLASSAMAYPADFVPQCCLLKDGFPVTDIPTIEVFDFVAGYSEPLCLGETSPSFDCISWENLCTVEAPKAPISFGNSANFPCNPDGTPNPVGLNCCNPAINPAFGGFADQAWTCSNLLGGFSAVTQSDLGFLCGIPISCKDGLDKPFCVGRDCIGCLDPHFQKWDGEWYDFHGECDLIFLEEPKFHKGLGLSIHIRTKARYDYSYIESAVVKIGDDVLQVNSFGEYFFNGVETADLTAAKFSDAFAVEYEKVDKKKSVFTIPLEGEDGNQKIVVQTFKDMVSVKIDNAIFSSFENSAGLMGDFAEGKMLARDGTTVIVDPVEFGMEWQVKPEEPMLFQSVGHPATEQCLMPSKTARAERRRLGEGVAQDAAEAACAAVDNVHHDNCVYDVMATGDLEIAHAGVF